MNYKILGIISIAILLVGLFAFFIFKPQSQETQTIQSQNPKDIQVEDKNVKLYDEKTRIATILENTSTQEKISNVQLKSPQIVKVGLGYQKVAEFEVRASKGYSNALEKMELYDMRNNFAPINRQLNYKYLTYENVSVDDYGCVSTSSNGTCINGVVGSHIEQKEKWLDLADWDFQTGEVLTIGIFTQIDKYETVEWIPTFFGARINEWATWDASLENGIRYWYKFDETDGTVAEDTIGNYNATNISVGFGLSGVSFITKNAFNFTPAGDNYVSASEGLLNYNSSSFSVNMWVNLLSGTNSTPEEPILMHGGGTTDYYSYIQIPYSSGAKAEARIRRGANDLTLTSNGSAINDSQWHMITWVRDTSVSKMYLYQDAVLVAEGTEISVATNPMNITGNVGIGAIVWTGVSQVINNEVEGRIDEVGGWNRTLTQSEITTLYNGGNGCTWQECVSLNLKLTLLSPANNTQFPTNNIDFSANVTNSSTISVSNVTIEVFNANGTLAYNNINTSGILGIYNWTSITLADGNYNWTVYAYGNDSVRYNATNGTLIFSVNKFVLNSMTYNSTTVETATETFTANITIDPNDGTPTGAIFNYNGTNYTGATVTNTAGNNYDISRTIDIPTGTGTKNFSFYFTLSGIQQTTNSTQTVSVTNFSLCDASLTTQFLNVTFKDEDTLTAINASIPTSTWVYWLGTGATNKTLTYSNTNNNYNYTFCATPTDRNFYVTPKVQYKQGTDYPQRIWEPTLRTYNSTMTTQVLYLLNTNDGIFVTYQVVNSAGQPIADVDVVSTRTVEEETTTVGVGTTDSAGLVTFWLNPDFVHTTTFTKLGFDTYTLNHFPTQSSYTIILSSGTEEIDDFTYKVNYFVQPTAGTDLETNTNVNFNFTINSTYWNLTSFQFTLYDDDDNVIGGNSSSSSNSGTILNVINVSNHSQILMVASWTANGTTIDITFIWNVFDTSQDDWSIKTFFTDLSTFSNQGIFGLTSFGLSLIIFVVIFVSTGIMAYKFGLISPAVISGVVFVLVFLFDVGLGLIPTPVSAVPHFITFLFGMIMIGFIIKEATT